MGRIIYCMPEIEPAVLEHIKTILRRDLKLGPDIAIADDMPFFGGEVDLDSLDMLLLVTTIEKELGLKIPSEAVGKEVFENVTTLARYVQANRGTASAPQTPAQPNYLTRLPHREPFRFISKTTEVTQGESAQGIWSVSGEEAFFAGHFPGNPIVPGVLIAEALAQLSGIAGNSDGGKLAQVDVRFDQSVVPPAEISLSSKLMRTIGALQLFDVSASVGGNIVARGTLTLHRGK
jgi:3-hydroxyacyl-[acyl-carrier-protein] dehydratase